MIHQISDTVRIEDGPARKRCTCTADIKAAAERAMVGKPIPGRVNGPFDSAGRPMVVGEDMEYLDRDDIVYHVYQWRTVTQRRFDPATGEPMEITRDCYVEVGCHETLEEAQQQAGAL